jgi:hypothetical protein
MVPFEQILKDWRRILESGSVDEKFGPKSLRVLDFDHTVAFTGEKVYIMSPEGKIVDTLDSEEYSHHEFTKDEAMAGYYYDFREFDDVNTKAAKENPHVTAILRNFVNAGPERIIVILTARNQEAEDGIRSYLESIGIDHSSVSVVGVGSSQPQKKVDVVKQMLDKYDTIKAVSFFDDSVANTDEMKNFLDSYSKEPGKRIDFDVAIVDSEGKLVRMPGYRSKRRRDVKSRR